MTASLYQSAVSGSSGCPAGRTTPPATSCLSSRNTEHVCRQLLRVEHHEVAAAVPRIAARRDQVLDLVGVSRRAVEVDMAGLRVAHVEVHAHQDQVVALLLRV